MKNEKLEKQASSEIADFTWNDHAEEFLMEHYPNILGKWRFLVPILGAFAEKVERDTRERCAQERKELLKNLASAMRKVLPSQLLQDVIDRCDPLSAFLREIGEKSLAERIRGKE